MDSAVLLIGIGLIFWAGLARMGFAAGLLVFIATSMLVFVGAWPIALIVFVAVMVYAFAGGMKTSSADSRSLHQSQAE